MRLGIFGGSFDPVHKEHLRLAKAAVAALGLDRIFIVPSRLAPHKAEGAHAEGDLRAAMLSIAFRRMKTAEVSDFELRSGGTSYTYLTCKYFRERFPEDELFFLVGADMFEDFPHWREPREILASCTLAVAGRGEDIDPAEIKRFEREFSAKIARVPFVGEEVSSTAIRTELAFGKRPAALDGQVYAFIRRNGLYAEPVIPAALALESPQRRKHSLRVALMACGRAKSLGIPERSALLASALHDCGKNVPLSSPMLLGFDLPQGVPMPVVHQFTGAYLAEHTFGVRDKEVLDAIRYHTSGRAEMGTLEKLIYLSDLLESEREFAGIAKLRELFWKDLDACFLASLALQIDHLRSRGGELCPLTLEAYEWEKRRRRTEN